LILSIIITCVMIPFANIPVEWEGTIIGSQNHFVLGRL
jgi:hypothetical protein